MCGDINELYNIVFICKSSTCFNLFNMSIILEHLFDTFSVFFFQFRFVSKVNPKKLNSSTYSIFM